MLKSDGPNHYPFSPCLVSSPVRKFGHDGRLNLCHESLEQITGYLKANSMPTVSHESIYQRTYANKRVGGILHRALRRRKHYVWRLRATRHSPQSSVD